MEKYSTFGQQILSSMPWATVFIDTDINFDKTIPWIWIDNNLSKDDCEWDYIIQFAFLPIETAHLYLSGMGGHWNWTLHYISKAVNAQSISNTEDYYFLYNFGLDYATRERESETYIGSVSGVVLIRYIYWAFVFDFIQFFSVHSVLCAWKYWHCSKFRKHQNSDFQQAVHCPASVSRSFVVLTR